ncbi:MAG: SRPBCC family protein [Candidatus Didemnitutus sp.]|jgi:uncharacterized membrane protein YhaH (DUF805 family)|nr:SRPBCC family protein [Candidatus Didemnitutus sp.]
MHLSTLWARLDPRGVTTRRDYAVTGIVLLAVKLVLDRVLVATLGGPDIWSALAYWMPSAVGRPDQAAIPGYAVALLISALPFIGVGVLLTLRRLRAAGWPLWLVGLFFVPAINIVLFALLSVMPSRETPRSEPSHGLLGWLAGKLALRSRALSAAVAILLTVLLAVPVTWVATEFFSSYGWGVFVGLPFTLGLMAAVIHGAPEPRTWASCAGVALLALTFSAAAILALALEGAICLLMAAPLATPLVLMGATVGYFLQLMRWGSTNQVRMYAASWVALPLALASERWTQPEPRLMSVTTTVEIAAPCETVWRHVVTFSELPPPAEAVFRTGIAYPIRASIDGQGVGAVRRCEFSTGPFVEPITVWDEPRRLAFDVVEQPHPMREWSPYRALHTPHLEGFFRSEHGEFRLVPTGSGTRLEGTTWYSQRFWPASYWQQWSDALVHTIHRRVLEHIRREAEADKGT